MIAFEERHFILLTQYYLFKHITSLNRKRNTDTLKCLLSINTAFKIM